MVNNAVDQVAAGDVQLFLRPQQIKQGAAPERELLTHGF
jgi:hypothetical protein